MILSALVLVVLALAVVATGKLAGVIPPARAAEESPLDRAIERTARRYQRAAESRGTYFYVRGKLSGDPATRAVATLGPLGSVLDLGCGRGQLAVLLLEAGVAFELRGVDWDAQKIALARRAGEGLAAVFEPGDAREVSGAPADTVLMIDVLHYFDRPVQDALLVRASGLVKPGGRLVLRDADTGRGLRSLATRIQEGVGTRLRFNRGERVLFRDVEGELVPLLEARGFACEVRPCWGRTPFSNVLLVATRSPLAS